MIAQKRKLFSLSVLSFGTEFILVHSSVCMVCAEAQPSGAQPGAQQRAPSTPSRPAQPQAEQAQQQTAPVSPFASPSSSQPQQPFPAAASPAGPPMATPGSQGVLQPYRLEFGCSCRGCHGLLMPNA